MVKVIRRGGVNGVKVKPMKCVCEGGLRDFKEKGSMMLSC